MANKGKADSKPETGANLGFEAKLWQMADGLRNNMDAAEYKHVVLGLIFLKYISDAFEAKHAELETQRRKGADPEDPDEYKAASIFWVPKEARWSGPQLRTDDETIYRGDREDFADSREVMRRAVLFPASKSDGVSLTPSMSVEV